MKKIRTVLGEILPESLGVVLPHEHICCYSEYARMMANGIVEKERSEAESERNT